MSRYPSEYVARVDQQFAETEYERNERLRRKRLAKLKSERNAAEKIEEGQS